MIAILMFLTLCVLFPEAALRLLKSLLLIVGDLLLQAWRAAERRLAEEEGREPRDFPPERR